jgi:hypothetical protein
MSIAKEEEKLRVMQSLMNETAQLLRSTKGLSLCNQLLIDFLDDNKGLYSKWATPEAAQYSISFNTLDKESTVTVQVPSLGFKREWDEISHLVNDIWSSTALTYRYEKRKKVGNVTLLVTDFCIADIPEEDMNLLKILGKIREEVKPATIEKVMTCGGIA